MAFNIKDKALTETLERHLGKAQKEHADSLEKLSSGQIFTRTDPRPTERALAEGLEFKLRSLAASKRSTNSAIGLLQTAESGLNEITNMVLRMKEINTAAASSTVSERDRKFLFIEYEALHDEINRIAATTEYQGVPLLNGNDPKALEELIFRVGDAFPVSEDLSADQADINVITLKGLKSLVSTTGGLGIRSARELLSNTAEEEGLTLDDVLELMAPEDVEVHATVYDQALHKLATQRTLFGGLQSRLQRTLDYIDVYHENITAAKSSIADIDYAKEVSRMIESRILIQASTSALAQGNVSSQLALSLINAAL